MTPDRHAEIRRICQAALDRPPSDRARYVAEACGEDGEMRREVEALLTHDPSADDFLATGAFGIEARAASKLNHPNIVSIFDVDEQDGLSCHRKSRWSQGANDSP